MLTALNDRQVTASLEWFIREIVSQMAQLSAPGSQVGAVLRRSLYCFWQSAYRR